MPRGRSRIRPPEDRRENPRCTREAFAESWSTLLIPGRFLFGERRETQDSERCPVAKGQVKRSNQNKPKLTVKEKFAKKQAKKLAKAK